MESPIKTLPKLKKRKNVKSDICYLKNKNPHEKDEDIIFKEKEHEYIVRGKKYDSVTTFIGTLFEKFDSDKIIADILENEKIKNPKYEYYNMSKKEILKKWSESTQLGTNLHADIENFYNLISKKNDSIETNKKEFNIISNSLELNKLITANDSKELKKLEFTHKNSTELYFTIDNNSVEWTYFMNFYNDHKKHLEPYRTEFRIYSEKVKISGTIDMLFLKKIEDGKIYVDIYDWKRAKNIYMGPSKTKPKEKLISNMNDNNYEHYSLQLNLYKYILETEYNFIVEEMHLVVFHPYNDNYQKIEVRNLQKEIIGLMEKLRM